MERRLHACRRPAAERVNIMGDGNVPLINEGPSLNRTAARAGDKSISAARHRANSAAKARIYCGNISGIGYSPRPALALGGGPSPCLSAMTVTTGLSSTYISTVS